MILHSDHPNAPPVLCRTVAVLNRVQGFDDASTVFLDARPHRPPRPSPRAQGPPPLDLLPARIELPAAGTGTGGVTGSDDEPATASSLDNSVSAGMYGIGTSC